MVCSLFKRHDGILTSLPCLRWYINQISWRYMTPWKPSQVIYLYKTKATTFHGCGSYLLSNLIPFLTKAFQGSRNYYMIFGFEIILQYNFSPICGDQITSTKISFVTSTIVPTTTYQFSTKLRAKSRSASSLCPYKFFDIFNPNPLLKYWPYMMICW